MNSHFATQKCASLNVNPETGEVDPLRVVSGVFGVSVCRFPLLVMLISVL